MNLSTTTDRDLLLLARRYDIDVRIFMVEQLADIAHPRTCIINADDEGRGGTHWVAVYHGDNQDYNIAFDPFGMPTDERIRSWLHQSADKQAIAITTQLQDIQAQSCGWWCIYFLHSMSIGMHPAHFLARLSGTDQAANEQLLEQFFV